MNLLNTTVLLAQAAPGQQQDPRAQLFTQVGIFAIMGVMFYLVLIRPQQKRAKQQAEMLKTIKVGDDVVTGSGIVGRVTAVRENSVTLRSEDAKIEVLKSAVTDVTRRDADPSKN